MCDTYFFTVTLVGNGNSKAYVRAENHHDAAKIYVIKKGTLYSTDVIVVRKEGDLECIKYILVLTKDGTNLEEVE